MGSFGLTSTSTDSHSDVWERSSGVRSSYEGQTQREKNVPLVEVYVMKVSMKLKRDLLDSFSCRLEEEARWTSELLLPAFFRAAAAAEDAESAAGTGAAAADDSRKKRRSSLLDGEELEEQSFLEGRRKRRN